MIVGIVGAVGAVSPAPDTAAAQDAAEVIESIWKRVGGKEAYGEACYLEFTWVVEVNGKSLRARRHAWDRWTGAYVLGTRDPETGDTVSVHFNVNDMKGDAFLAGEPVDADAAAAYVEKAFAAFINDTYWLLAHVKLEDPGVKVSVQPASAGSEGGGSVLHLSFDNVGLTPGDQYWLSVDSSGRVTRWRFRLEGGQKRELLWKDERDCGMGLRFATSKESADGSFRVYFPEVKFSRSAPPGMFETAD
jgi:hypothetical protein